MSLADGAEAAAQALLRYRDRLAWRAARPTARGSLESRTTWIVSICGSHYTVYSTLDSFGLVPGTDHSSPVRFGQVICEGANDRASHCYPVILLDPHDCASRD